MSESNLDFAKILEKIEEVNSIEKITSDDILIAEEDDEEIPFIDGYIDYKQIRQESDILKIKESHLDIDQAVGAEEQADGGVAFSIWKRYFRAGASIFGLILLIFVLLFSQIVTSGSDYFVNYWTQQETLRENGETMVLQTNDCLYLYCFFIIGVIIVSICIANRNNSILQFLFFFQDDIPSKFYVL